MTNTLIPFFVSFVVISLLSVSPLAAQQSKPNAQNAKPPVKTSRLVLQNHQSVKSEFDIVYAEYGDRKMHLDLFTPKSATGKLPCVVVVHGGGWLKGDKSKFQPMAEAFAARGYIAANVEYRLGGEALFPAGVQDCFGAVRFLRDADRLGIDPEKIAAVGGSAGGHIVGLMAAAPDVSEFEHDAHAKASSRIQAAVVMAGPMDLADGSVAERSRSNPEESNSNKWIGKTVDEALETYKLGSPIRHIDAKTPPFFYMCGEYENPANFEPSKQKLAEFGTPSQTRVYRYGKHGCWNQHPWFDVMIEDIDQFFASTLKVTPVANYQIANFDWGSLNRSDDQFELKLDSAQSLKKGVLIPRYHCRIGDVKLAGNDSVEIALTPGFDDWNVKATNGKEVEGLGDGPVTATIQLLDKPVPFTLPIVVSPDDKGNFNLHAYQANPHGELIRFEPQPHKNTVGYWAGKNDSVDWQLLVMNPGKYRLRILQGCGTGQGGSTVAISSGKSSVDYTVTDTGHFQNFEWFDAGELELSQGVQDLTITIKSLAKNAIMDVRQIELTRVSD